MKFIAKFMREFEVEIDAPDIKIADAFAKQVLKEISGGRLLSILPEGYVEPVDPPPQLSPPHRPGNKPVGGGTPGTPVVSTGAPPVDQIAKAA